MFYNKVMTTYSGKKDLPGRHSSVDIARGEPFPAALAHVLWKQLERAAGEAGCARTHCRFEALKPDFYKPVVCWEGTETTASPFSQSRTTAGSLLLLMVVITYIKFPGIKQRTVKHILGNKHPPLEGTSGKSSLHP